MCILAIDQGTTGTTTILYSQTGTIIDKAYREFPQYYPKPGWVEHNAMEIWQTVLDTVQEILERNTIKIEAIGITNQRETTILWDKHTHEPLHNAIVWQCRRTTEMCDEFKHSTEMITEKTGLPLDAYFSATKIKWLLNNASNVSPDNIVFGTIDTWLIWKLTGGQVHATDHTNASRTLLYNIAQKKWDEDLLNLFNIPASILPEVKCSIDAYGTVQSIAKLQGVPIYAVAGDQQAALFGQTCFHPGMIKNTYGTGCFMVMNTGNNLIRSKNGLVTTLAVDGNGNACYALEGSIFIAGAAIQWLRDELKLIEKASDSEQIAYSVEDNHGVYFVPAFVGLAAPHWNMAARGTITGLTRGANKAHIIRAALEAMAYQSYDVFTIMQNEMKVDVPKLMVDGGAVMNNFLMQFQADILNKPVLVPNNIESTSLGVAMMAGLKAGIWRSYIDLEALKHYDKTFIPTMNEPSRQKLIDGWHKALKQTLLL
ncbi:MAG: glycerol kinase [Candidatus Margulisbacteria bacterium GWF2_35_9]|nr:MAG: glycerol kinase [Candidatus Margulisbacteria bacterium GWF2_35_9]